MAPACAEYAKLAIRSLNQIIRLFTPKWYRLSLADVFKGPERCCEFRVDLSALQHRRRDYTRALAAMAKVEDLTNLEQS